MFVGLLLLSIGLLFLLDNLNIVDGRAVLRTFWSVALPSGSCFLREMGRVVF